MAREISWSQTTLLPADAVEAVLRIGFVGSADHAQVQFEVLNATSDELIAMEATPHTSVKALAGAAHAALDKLLATVLEHAGIF